MENLARGTSNQAPVDVWFAEQDRAVDAELKVVRRNSRRRQRREPEINPAELVNSRGAESESESGDLPRRIIGLVRAHAELRTSIENVIRSAIQEFKNGTFNTAGHEVAIVKRRSEAGFFHMLVIDGVVQGETQVWASEY
jgi:hypothetical protein